MKKAISILLVLVLVLSLWACGSNTSASDYIGVWQNKGAVLDGYQYIYVYRDGTGDYYGTGVTGGKYHHFNPFVWKIEGEYFVKESDGSHGTTIYKYTLEGDRLLDKQGKVAFIRVSQDTSVDLFAN